MLFEQFICIYELGLCCCHNYEVLFTYETNLSGIIFNYIIYLIDFKWVNPSLTHLFNRLGWELHKQFNPVTTHLSKRLGWVGNINPFK